MITNIAELTRLPEAPRDYEPDACRLNRLLSQREPARIVIAPVRSPAL